MSRRSNPVNSAHTPGLPARRCYATSVAGGPARNAYSIADAGGLRPQPGQAGLRPRNDKYIHDAALVMTDIFNNTFKQYSS